MNKNRIIEDYLQGKHPIEQESWELPSADELERDEALFDSLMAKKKASSSLTPCPLQGERELKRRRLWPWAGWIAASIVIAFIFWPNSSEVVEQPVVAELVEQPVQEVPKVSENSEVSEKSEPTESIKPKRTYKTRKVSKPQEEPMLAEAEMTKKVPTENIHQRRIEASNPYLIAAAQAQDIRSRGERLSQEVALLIEQ